MLYFATGCPQYAATALSQHRIRPPALAQNGETDLSRVAVVDEEIVRTIGLSTTTRYGPGIKPKLG